jgi:hypothetical protein
MAAKNPMISKRWLINYVLILLIAVFTFVGNRYNVQTGHQPENRISTLKSQDIKQVSIQTADSSILLNKVGTSWQIESPILWHANNITVERIIDLVNAQTDSRLPASDIDLSTLGLKFPKAILKLNETEFLFGATNNIGERRYLQNGETVYLLQDRYLPFISQGISCLIDRRLLPRALPLQSLKLSASRLNKTDNSSWQSSTETISEAQASQIINRWQTLEATQIKTYQTGQTPMQKIIAGLDNGGQIEFYLLSITPKIVIARPDLGLQYHFNENHYYGLLAAPKDEAPAS